MERENFFFLSEGLLFNVLIRQKAETVDNLKKRFAYRHKFKTIKGFSLSTFDISNLLHVHFHRNFSFIFSLILSENARNVRFREAKFQNLPGKHAPGLLLV